MYAGFFLVGVSGRPLLASLFSIGLAPISIWLSVVDIKWFRIPDLATLTIAALGVVAISTLAPDLLLLHTVSAIIVGGVFWVISEVLFRLLKREAFGLGDVKLISASTIWVGPFGMTSVILFAALGAIALVALSRNRYLRVAFGPFLALSLFVVWLHGPLVI